MTTYTKDPSALLDYSTDWTPWLASGETIIGHTVTVPTGLTKVSDGATTTVVTAWLSNGTVGTVYPVVYDITTSAGRHDQRTLRVRVQER